MASLLDRFGNAVLGEQRLRAVKRFVEHQDPRYRALMHRLKKFQARHTGKRCFIIGNGPSLKNTDLSLLKDEYTFCTNRFYLMFDKIGFTPSYYVCSNDLVVEQCAADIVKLPMPKFIGWHNRDFIDFTSDMTFLWTRCGLRSWFFTDLTEGCWEGSTVTMVAIQLAYYMGFKEVVLIGVDHSYQFSGDPHAPAVAEGADPNHFDPNYFSNGFKWHLPDLKGSEMSYTVAKYMYETSGRKIVDATVGGKLQVFEKADYYSLFGQSAVGSERSAA